MRQDEKRKREILTIFLARDLLTIIALILALFITYKLWNTARETESQTLQTGFNFRVHEFNSAIQQRMAIYEQVLHATQGLFHANKAVSRGQFHAFIEALALPQNYPGIQGIGFAQLIPPSRLERQVAAVRSEGFPNYTVWPAGKRDVYTSIIYLEPFTGKNLRAFGYDMYSNPIRREAMQQALASGEATVTGKVTLVQEAGAEVQVGFLMYLPLYDEAALQKQPGARRQDNLLGWVYAPFRMKDFMRGINSGQAEDLDIAIYDGDQLSPATLMFDSGTRRDGTGLQKIDRIDLGNHTWTVVTSATPAYLQRLTTGRPRLILHAGISISLMVALLIWLFLDDRARALHAAHQAMQLALYDALTGLPNRKLLDERLTLALSHAKRSHSHAALLFIDLDKFKPVNDNFGHAYGDLLLKEVAKRLRENMRESDTASRLGGDEFVVLLLDVDSPQAVMLVATKILQHLNEPYDVAGHTFHISASIGAALYPEHGTDGKTLMRSADLAMYQAKNKGRANVQFAPSE
ncbi:CHASE domain-containing protein [Noviherbaspirillum sp. UKPF54]|uniref:CHASE domain-containing protein n=1 Tax=Noviherbaspirillum sp. UKPF54 TaxID=2601898 RepID=UPI0011B1AEAB|nr:CHASE domain-containing protein [Noviherbaspirillum sp. UKPF54]QDZ29096.1 diguanylate cyclase [Noviherbaspirillum sp. UKPF54]